MRKYLANLQNKSDHHKQRFALLVSATITLFIFGFWSLATFGVSQQVAERESEVKPLESLSANVISSLDALKNDLVELKSALYLYGR